MSWCMCCFYLLVVRHDHSLQCLLGCIPSTSPPQVNTFPLLLLWKLSSVLLVLFSFIQSMVFCWFHLRRGLRGMSGKDWCALCYLSFPTQEFHTLDNWYHHLQVIIHWLVEWVVITANNCSTKPANPCGWSQDCFVFINYTTFECKNKMSTLRKFLCKLI